MGGQPSRPTHQLRPRPPRLRRIILNFLKGNWVGLMLLAADLSGYWYDRSFLLQDLHFNGCDGLVALPGGFEAFLRHCVDLPVLIALSRVLCLLRQAYKVLQSSYFSFCGDLLSTPHFPLLCCRPDSNTERPDPAVPLSGRRKYFQNVRAFIF